MFELEQVLFSTVGLMFVVLDCMPSAFFIIVHFEHETV
jgi:hypothetical protein